MPLVALLGEDRFLAEALTDRDRGKDFICPACKVAFRVVLPKTGIVKHFRHITGAEHWEPETGDHLSMKLEVSKMAESLGWSTILEQRIGLGDDYAIADVYVDDGKDRIAIECQCSNVTVEDFERRDEFYRQLRIIPLWILGGKFEDNVLYYRKWERSGREPYRIQRISGLEKILLREDRLFYYVNGGLHIGAFTFRWKRKMHDREADGYDEYECNETLGWFRLKKTTIMELINKMKYESEEVIEENEWK